MCRLAFILTILPFLGCGQPFTERDIAFLGKKDATVPSTLDNSLISYWKLDEESGTRVDSEPTGTAQDLTDNNTVTSNPGKIGNAGQFTAANNERLSRTDSADLSVGDIDFTIAAWVYMDTKPSFAYVAAKGANEYYLLYQSDLDRFVWTVGNTGTLSATNFGSPSTATWYLIIAWHDSVNNQIGISVNNGTADTAAWSSGSSDTIDPFNIGTVNGITTVDWNGRIDEVGFWKKVLTAGERTELYNAGVGKTCCPFQ